tara:strand:- start:884 stop:1327 length:444 start_codon:yes stop_codon:yes gene_type:complete
MHSTRVLEIPVSITATDAVRYFRIACENRGWAGSRLEESKVVHRWAIIMPITNSARVLGMEIEEGIAEGLSLRAWSYTPGSAGIVTIVSFEIPESIDGEVWLSFLRDWTDSLPRCPWKWSFWERSMIGYFIPEFRKSKRVFSSEGLF